MIYFIRPVGGGNIKIGTTIRLSQRLKELTKDVGQALEVLAVVEGGLSAERQLHEQFAHLRVTQEWFEPGDDLTGFIVSEATPWDGEDEEAATKPVRLDLSPVDYDRLSKHASRLGLSMAACARMVVIEAIRIEEAKLCER